MIDQIGEHRQAARVDARAIQVTITHPLAPDKPIVEFFPITDGLQLVLDGLRRNYGRKSSFRIDVPAL